MRDYGKLSPFFWTRGSGKKLRGHPEAQVVAAYLSTAPAANMIGIYYVALATISSDTGIPQDRAREALKLVADAGYAFYDSDDEIAWVPNHAKFEIGDQLRPGDKRRPRVYAELNQVSDHRFATDFRKRYASGYGLEPPTEGASKGHPATKTDTEGASASGAGARAGQDRTGSGSGSGQDSSGGHPPEARVVGPDGEGGAVFEAWRRGVRDVTGKPVSSLNPSERREVVDFANAHAGGARSEALVAWVRETAAAFVRANEARFGFTPKRCKVWLDGGRQDCRGSPRSQPVQSAENRSWIVPKEMP